MGPADRFYVRRPIERRDRGLRCRLFVEIHPPYGTASNATKNFPVATYGTEAIVDTGSERTLIRADIADRIGLELSNFTDIVIPGVPKPVECFTAYAQLRFSGDNHRIWGVPCDIVVVKDMRHEVLLGMDSFEEGEIRVNFRENWWSFQVTGEPTHDA